MLGDTYILQCFLHFWITFSSHFSHLIATALFTVLLELLCVCGIITIFISTMDKLHVRVLFCIIIVICCKILEKLIYCVFIKLQQFFIQIYIFITYFYD